MIEVFGRMSGIPTMWHSPETGIVLMVHDLIDVLLDQPLVEAIQRVHCQYSPMNDTVEIIVQRKRDEMRARFEIERDWLVVSVEPTYVATTFKHYKPEDLARLILFLA